MASIKIRGLNDPVIVSEVQGKKAKALFLDDFVKGNHIIDLDDRAFKKSEIVSITLDPSIEERLAKEEEFKKMSRMFVEEYDRQVQYTPERKAEINRPIFTIWNFAYTGKNELTDIEWGFRKSELVKYFELNPRRTKLDIRYFRQSMPQLIEPEHATDGRMGGLAAPLRRFAIRMVEQSTAHDMAYAQNAPLVMEDGTVKEPSELDKFLGPQEDLEPVSVQEPIFQEDEEEIKVSDIPF